jgi:hypothetical protein
MDLVARREHDRRLSQALMGKDDTPSTKPLLDKLGVKPHYRVTVIGVEDESFLSLLRGRVGDVTVGRTRASSDLIFYGAPTRKALARLKTLRKSLAPDGALWTVRPKGTKEITESDTMAAGKEAGLVDVKVVSFSPTHTAEKFVIPLASR